MPKHISLINADYYHALKRVNTAARVWRANPTPENLTAWVDAQEQAELAQ